MLRSDANPQASHGAARQAPRARVADLVEEFWDLPLVESLSRAGTAVPVDDFRDAFHQMLERRGQLHLTGSARQALQILFTHLAARSSRRRVLLASFNCRVVREAAQRSRLTIDTFDFASVHGRMDWAAIGAAVSDAHLAVVVPHFFGVPTDFSALLPRARTHGTFVIEDCAHALGARIGGAPAGTLGDAAVFSFNYDKPISLAGGGALLINHEELSLARDSVERPPCARTELRQFRRMAAMLRYNRTPRARPSFSARVGRRLHVSPYATPPVPGGFGPLRAAVGLWQLQRYAAVRAQRDRNAQRLRPLLGPLLWHVDEGVTPAHLKLRVTLNAADGLRASQYAREHRVAIANSNWPRLIDPQGAGAPRPQAAGAAALGLEVPVHQNLSDADLAVITEAFAGAREP